MTYYNYNKPGYIARELSFEKYNKSIIVKRTRKEDID